MLTLGNESFHPDSEHMAVAKFSPSRIHSIVSMDQTVPDIWGSGDKREMNNSRDREVHIGSSLDRPDDA